MSEPSVIGSEEHVSLAGNAPDSPQPQNTRYSFGVVWTCPP